MDKTFQKLRGKNTLQKFFKHSDPVMSQVCIIYMVTAFEIYTLKVMRDSN